MSPIRKQYFLRLVGRVLVLLMCGVTATFSPESFSVLYGMNFFTRFSALHVLWLIWMLDMLYQILPIKSRIPLGSKKLFAIHFRPIREWRMRRKALKKHIIESTKAAYRVMLLWCFLIAGIGVLYAYGVIGKLGLFMIVLLFYVCDLICVLIWCPFRLMMKTKCCTTCRIFNWDHLMMFSPLLFMGGFYANSLLMMAILSWLVWELCVAIYPERFWEVTNVALTCSQCTDKLCTQYCKKLGKES